jgi:hypothetical protein
VGQYAGLLGRACPAGVYEYNDAEGADEDARGKKFVINSQVRCCPLVPPLLSPFSITDSLISILSPLLVVSI